MAALYLHNAIFTPDTPDTSSRFPHSRTLSSGTASVTTSTQLSHPTEPLLSSSTYRDLLSRQPGISDGLQSEMSLSFDGGSDSPIERERRGYWEQSVRRRLRLLKAAKVSLELIMVVWALYNTIRYFLAFTIFSSMSGQQVSLALGTSTAVSVGLFACAAVVSALQPYLIAKHIPIHSLLVTRTVFRYLGSFFLLSPAVVNQALTIAWRHSPDVELDPDRRCQLDIDVIWSVSSSTCSHPMWAAWLGLSLFRTLMTLIITISFLTISSVYQLTRRPSQSSARRRRRRQRRVQSESTFTSVLTSPPMSITSPGQPVSLLSPPIRHPSRSSIGSQVNSRHSLRSGESSIHTHNRNSRDSSTTHNRNSTVSTSSEGGTLSDESPSDARFDPAAIQQRLSEAISPSTALYAQSDRDLNNFVDKFRSLVSQIQRETEEAIDFTRSDSTESGEEYPPEGVDNYTAYPTRQNLTSSSAQSNNLYAQFVQGSSTSAPSAYSRYGGSYVSYNEFGLPYPPDDQIRILNGYVKRMPTIESLGSREFGEYGSRSNRSMSMSSHERLGSVGTLSRPPTRATTLALTELSMTDSPVFIGQREIESPSTDYGSVYSHATGTGASSVIGLASASERFGSASERSLGSEPPSRANSLGGGSLGKGPKGLFGGTETVVDVNEMGELVDRMGMGVAKEDMDGSLTGSLSSGSAGSPRSAATESTTGSVASKGSYYTAGGASIGSPMLTPTSEVFHSMPEFGGPV